MRSSFLRKSRYALFLLGFLIYSTSLAVEEEVFTPVEGTKVSLLKPAGYESGHTFDGFERAGGGSSIAVVEIEGPFSQVSAAVTAENLAPDGGKLLEKGSVKIAGHDGLLIHTTQSIDGKELLKWIAVFGDESESVVLTALFPEAEKAELSEPLRKVVTTAKWNRPEEFDPLAEASFTIDPPQGLAFAQRFSKLISFAPAGSQGAGDPTQPSFAVGPLENPFQNRSYEDVALAFLESKKDSYTVTNLSESRSTTIDDLPGWLIRAEAMHVAEEVPLGIYLVVLFESEALYMISGVAGAEEFEVYGPRFAAAASSFRRKGRSDQ
jgi:hypothetical protein